MEVSCALYGDWRTFYTRLRVDRRARMIVHSDLAGYLSRCLVVVLAVALTAGCATNTKPGVLNFGVGVSPEAKRITWPPLGSGDVPRYVYAGELTGEENFREPEKKKTGVSAFLQWLAGLFDADAALVVLQRPQSGVTDEDGRIFVTDTSRQAVFVFDQKKGSLDVWEYAMEATRFVAPAGIALGEAGDVYVADAEQGFVTRLGRDGKSIGIIGKGELLRPVGLAVDTVTHQLYVADTYAHDIKVFDANGRLLRTLGQRGDKPGDFNYPTYIALAKGELYVADTMNARVQVLDAETGQPKRVIGERGLYVGNLVRPKGVAVDDEGNVYVVESYYDHLLVFNNAGDFLMPIGGTGSGVGNFYLPSGVWADAHNRIYVADMFNGRVSIFQFLGGEAEK